MKLISERPFSSTGSRFTAAGRFSMTDGRGISMTLEELIREVPELEEYIRYMPEELWQRYTIRVYPPGTIIHQKDYVLNSFGLIARGEHRVINEFQNGNVYMIEKNEPIDFVGEVTILAGMEKTSVTIETLTKRPWCSSPGRISRTGFQRIFIFSALWRTKLPTSFTVPPTTGARGYSIRLTLSFWITS